MKLYEVAHDYLSLVEAIENEEIPEEAIADTLEAIEGEVEVKADNIACLLKEFAAEITAFKEEEAKLAKRRKVKERAYERLKTYLSDALLTVGIDKVETPRNKISFRRSEEVIVADIATFTEWALVHRDDLLNYPAPTINKTNIKKAIKDGAEIVGAEIRVNQNIQLN